MIAIGPKTYDFIRKWFIIIYYPRLSKVKKKNQNDCAFIIKPNSVCYFFVNDDKNNFHSIKSEPQF